MNFVNVKALAIPEGNVKQIADGQGVVLWKKVSDFIITSVTGEGTSSADLKTRTVSGGSGQGTSITTRTFTVNYEGYDTTANLGVHLLITPTVGGNGFYEASSNTATKDGNIGGCIKIGISSNLTKYGIIYVGGVYNNLPMVTVFKPTTASGSFVVTVETLTQRYNTTSITYAMLFEAVTANSDFNLFVKKFRGSSNSTTGLGYEMSGSYISLITDSSNICNMKDISGGNTKYLAQFAYGAYSSTDSGCWLVVDNNMSNKQIYLVIDNSQLSGQQHGIKVWKGLQSLSAYERAYSASGAKWFVPYAAGRTSTHSDTFNPAGGRWKGEDYFIYNNQVNGVDMTSSYVHNGRLYVPITTAKFDVIFVFAEVYSARAGNFTFGLTDTLPS